MNTSDKRIAIIVNPDLPLGLLANTVATIGIGIGAVETEFGATDLMDVTGRTITTSANRPVPILQAPNDTIRVLLLKALPPPEGALVVPFPRFARALNIFDDYLCEFPKHDLAKEEIDGVGISGPAKWVKSLTGSLKLLR
jgi:hypothetical protein